MWKTLAYDGQRGLALAPEPATKMQGFIFLTGTLETRERGLDALKQQRLFSGLKFQQVALGVEIDRHLEQDRVTSNINYFCHFLTGVLDSTSQCVCVCV